jgi:group I intron endonuclease
MSSTKSGIYELRNTHTGTRYVGSSCDLSQRKSQHFSHLRYDQHPNPLIRADCAEYGMDAFEFSIIEEVERSRLYAVEQSHIVIGDDHYNIAPYAHGGNGSHSPETKAKMSAAKLGKVNTAQHNENIRKAMIGRQFTDEHLERLTAANRRTAKNQHPDKGQHIREAKSTGSWLTPWGAFLSPYEAADACPQKCSSPSIRRYCTEGKSVSTQAFSRNEWLSAQGPEIIGVPFADLGFGFIPA